MHRYLIISKIYFNIQCQEMTSVLLRRTSLVSPKTRFVQHPFSTGNPQDIQDVVSVLCLLIIMTCFTAGIVRVYIQNKYEALTVSVCHQKILDTISICIIFPHVQLFFQSEFVSLSSCNLLNLSKSFVV